MIGKVERARERPETIHPGERSRFSVRRRVVAYVLAVVLPVAVAVAMIPFRVDHGRVAVLVLVIPVVLVALLGATGPAVVAAATAVLAYDFLLAEPYYSLAIDDTDEVVAALTLLAVAVVVGVSSARLVKLRVRESTRRDELRHLVSFIRANSQRHDEGELADIASAHIAEVLHLTDCIWQPGTGAPGGPLLLADGNLMGRVSEMKSDRAVLPDHLDLPVWRGGEQLGRFELTSTPSNVVSIEERVIAAAIAELFGQATARSSL